MSAESSLCLQQREKETNDDEWLRLMRPRKIPRGIRLLSAREESPFGQKSYSLVAREQNKKKKKRIYTAGFLTSTGQCCLGDDGEMSVRRNSHHTGFLVYTTYVCIKAKRGLEQGRRPSAGCAPPSAQKAEWCRCGPRKSAGRRESEEPRPGAYTLNILGLSSETSSHIILNSIDSFIVLHSPSISLKYVPL